MIPYLSNSRKPVKPTESIRIELPETQCDSIATAEKIMRVVRTEGAEKRKVSPDRVLIVTKTVETVPIPLHPESVGEGLALDCATINYRTVTSYRQGRVARALGSQSAGARTPLSTASSWHIRLGMAPGEPSKPADMVEEILRVAPPVIPGTGEAIDLADPKRAASMASFASFVTQAAEALRAVGTNVELLPAHIAA